MRMVAIRAVLVLAAVAYIVVMSTWLLMQPASLGFDIAIVARAGGRFLAGAPLYLDRTGARFVTGGLFYGPPVLAVLGAALSGLPERTVALGGSIVSLCVIFGSAVGLLFEQRASRATWTTTLVGLAASYAVFLTVTLTASSVLAVGLLTGAWLLRRRELTAGALIGTAAALRLYPAAILLALLVAGRRRTVAAGVAAAGAFTLAGFVLAGPSASLTFAGLAMHLASPASIAPARWLGPLAQAIGVGLLILSGLRLRRDPDDLIAYGLACAGMLWVSPLVWDHYVLALVPLVVGLAVRRPAFGFASAAMLPAWLAGGLVLVWLPVAGVVFLQRRDVARGGRAFHDIIDAYVRGRAPSTRPGST